MPNIVKILIFILLNTPTIDDIIIYNTNKEIQKYDNVKKLNFNELESNEIEMINILVDSNNYKLLFKKIENDFLTVTEEKLFKKIFYKIKDIEKRMELVKILLRKSLMNEKYYDKHYSFNRYYNSAYDIIYLLEQNCSLFLKTNELVLYNEYKYLYTKNKDLDKDKFMILVNFLKTITNEVLINN